MHKRSRFLIGLLVTVAVGCFLTATYALRLYYITFSEQELAKEPSAWGVFGDFVGGVLNPLLALVNITVVVFIAYELHYLESRRESDAAKAEQAAREATEARARHDRAISLHEHYLSPEFFSKVRGPASQVGFAWTYLPEPQRAAYREAVVQGWAYAAQDTLKLYVPQPPQSRDEVISYHFQTPKGLPSLTEHQALTTLLRFWTRIRTLIDLNMVDRDLVRSLFKDEFGYVLSFFKELSIAVTSKLPAGALAPRWIDDLTKLEQCFKP